MISVYVGNCSFTKKMTCTITRMSFSLQNRSKSIVYQKMPSCEYMNQTVIGENPSVCTVRKTNTQGCNMYVHYVHSSSTYIYILQFHAIKPQNLSLIFPRSFQFYSVTWRHFKHLSLVKISSACRPLYCAPQTLCSLRGRP